jgi:peptidoglycan hydrolase-like protein with peptidoglycan-binding domain
MHNIFEDSSSAVSARSARSRGDARREAGLLRHGHTDVSATWALDDDARRTGCTLLGARSPGVRELLALLEDLGNSGNADVGDLVGGELGGVAGDTAVVEYSLEFDGVGLGSENR